MSVDSLEEVMFFSYTH